MYSVLNCHNVAKHTQFYLGYLRFSMIFTGNAGCSRKIFTTLKAYVNLFKGYVRCLNCHNVAKHTEFYLR
jgi:hypothetical protein